MYSQLKKLLFCLPPEVAHDLTLKVLPWLPNIFLPKTSGTTKSCDILGLKFPNRVGLAAGLDKNGDYLDGLSKLGFGFIEIGTVTPKAQSGNPKPRLFRLAKDKAIINRMGFNNKGVHALIHNVKKAKYNGILGINIGKNLVTPVSKAVEDYKYVFNMVYDISSYITVNVSSPNTPGLRDLQHGELLKSLFETLKQQQNILSEKHKMYVPMLAKLAPDLTLNELKSSVDDLTQIGVDGFVFSNTTNDRTQLKASMHAEEAGGLSGQPLTVKSTELLKVLSNHTNLPIVGVGGIMNATDAKLKFEAGASLIQLYTGLIYQGPKLVQECISA